MNKVIFVNGWGEYFVTRNFSDAVPVWKKYRRFGWVLRYLFK